MAAIVRDRGKRQASDPALETGPDRRTQLQERLTLFAQVLIGALLAYWIGFVALWSGEPGIGFDGAIGVILSIPNAVLAAAYVALWLVVRGPVRSVRTLRVIDAVVLVGFGVWWGTGWLIAPVTPAVTLDYQIGIPMLLLLRALLVPSSWQRTAAIGAAAAVPMLISVIVWGDRQPLAITHRTFVGIYVNWSVLAVALSSVASGILYGMRREVRDARSLGQYTLLNPIGSGGMGVVYRARHAMLRRPTAVKLITPADDGRSVDRFEHEVQHMASLAHPNIVTVYDYGRTEDGTLYYAMELLDGADLERIVAQDGPLPASRVVFLLIQACRALAGAHVAGLVHRDIKPANLFVCRDWGTADALKILDFGLVKDLRGRGSVALTHQGAIMGTPLYMAPESWISPETVDARSDLYSLGAVAYYLLTGKPVFDGKNPFEVMAHHTHTIPVPPSQRGVAVPSDVEAVILRCLAKEPADRFASAELLRAHLEDCELVSAWRSSDARDWWRDHPHITPPRPLATTSPARPPQCIMACRRRETSIEPGIADTVASPQ